MITSNMVKVKKLEILLKSGKKYVFDDSKVLIHSRDFDIFAKAMDIIFGNRRRRQNLEEGDRVIAEVELTEPYFVMATKATFVAKDANGALCTSTYMDSLTESEECHFLRHFEDYKKEDYPHKLKDYRSFVDDELESFSDRTDGVGVTRGFRSYMASFIRNFKPELLVKGKPFVLTLNKKGEFCVEHLYCPGEPALLSTNELNIYHYMCYLHLSRFWSDVEHLRDQNHLNLPLIVDDFLDYLDEAMDKKELIKRALDMNREAFFASSTA